MSEANLTDRMPCPNCGRPCETRIEDWGTFKAKSVFFCPACERGDSTPIAPVPMTSEERQAQRISFAHGNVALDGSQATREDVERAAALIRHLQTRVAELDGRLNDILWHWQNGIGELDNPWRRKMAELVGDKEGLKEWKDRCDLEAERDQLRTRVAELIEANKRVALSYEKACEAETKLQAKLDRLRARISELGRIAFLS